MSILETKALCKRYGASKVLSSIDLKINAGEFVAIMGQSGCGKSTLLYCASGMDDPSSGQRYFDGVDMASLSSRQMQELYPMLFTGGAGVLFGVLLTELIGEKIVSALFSLLGLGITSFSFSAMTLKSVLVPFSLILVLVMINLGACMKIKKIDVSGYFNQ